MSVIISYVGFSSFLLFFCSTTGTFCGSSRRVTTKHFCARGGGAKKCLPTNKESGTSLFFNDDRRKSESRTVWLLILTKKLVWVCRTVKSKKESLFQSCRLCDGNKLFFDSQLNFLRFLFQNPKLSPFTTAATFQVQRSSTIHKFNEEN